MIRAFIKYGVLALLLLAGPLWADIQIREEQLIYSIVAFNGRDYARSFCREGEDTIYLIADENNFLSLRKTLVYYWPLSSEWLLDTDTMNVQLDGTLQIKGPKSVDVELNQVLYSVFNTRGEFELNWGLATGPEADQVFRDYLRGIDDFRSASLQFEAATAEYEAKLDMLTSEIIKLREAGEEYEAKLEELRNMEPPDPPQPMIDYAVPPSVPQLNFIVNLPAGTYEMHLVDDEDDIMEGSEKQIVIFESRRQGGMGYEVIPGDRWTRPIESNTPASVLYLDGKTDQFVQPFYQSEYNDLYYNKMLINWGRGNPSLMKWVRTQQIPQARVEITAKGQESVSIFDAPYIVEQLTRSTLGYVIVPFDSEEKHRGQYPNLWAFQIPRQGAVEARTMRSYDKDNELIPDSKRQLRIVSRPRSRALILIFAFLPLVAMIVALVVRTRRYKPSAA